MIMEATAGQNIWYSTMYKQKKRLPLSAHDHRKPIRQAVFTSLPTGNRVRTAYLHCIKDSTNIDQTMGTGLGLSIVKRIVELMDGTITVKSKVGKGTEFCIILRLPVRCSLRELEKEPEQKEISFRGARILLCEDNRLNTIIATKLLEKVGCIVETAENGKLGAEMFAASSPGYYAAVLMDIRMPEMDGLEAARAIRSPDRSDAKTIPIIAMSANAFAEDRQESLAAGMNAHLSKPIEPQKLYETLEREIAAGKDER